MKLQDMSVKERKARFVLVIAFSLLLVGIPLWALLFPNGAIFTFFLHLFFNDRVWTFGILIFFVIAFTGAGLHFCTLKWKALVADKAREAAFANTPERSEYATVISKMTHLDEYNDTIYHVAFALSSGERKNFTPPLHFLIRFQRERQDYLPTKKAVITCSLSLFKHKPKYPTTHKLSPKHDHLAMLFLCIRTTNKR